MHYLRATIAHRESESHTRVAVRNFQHIVAAVKKRDAQAAASACTAQVRYAAKVAREVPRTGEHQIEYKDDDILETFAVELKKNGAEPKPFHQWRYDKPQPADT